MTATISWATKSGRATSNLYRNGHYFDKLSLLSSGVIPFNFVNEYVRTDLPSNVPQLTPLLARGMRLM